MKTIDDNFHEKFPVRRDDKVASIIKLPRAGSSLFVNKVFDGWLPRDQATGAVVGGLKGAEEHYKKLSQKVGYNLPVPEALVNQFGYQLIAAGKLDEAIGVLKSNVERYPSSPNVYDSLAEAYERAGRLDLAKPNL